MSDTVRDNPALSRFELGTGDDLAVAAYRMSGDTITFTHTEVPPALRGGGLASRLVRGALDQARARGLRIVPLCSFVAAYVARHPEDRDPASDRRADAAPAGRV
ncbi:MAG: N-acetyltransferase [Rhodoplanes sp.]|nr:GNAT family N-acetyltransferase [Rhodoplanes sp.]NVO17110.1 N-acetyltransferase [Rhodoplanes sp.]